MITGRRPRCTNRSTTASNWLAATSVASPEEATRWVSNTKVPWPASSGKRTTLTDHPAWTHGVVSSGTLGMGTSVRSSRRFGFPAVQVAGIDSQKDVRTRAGKRCKLDKDLAQLLGINLAVLKRFIQAGQRRWKNGESDNSGKLWAAVSLLRASIVLNSASPACLKHPETA